MAQDEKQLPEGTDKVIAGSSVTGGDTMTDTSVVGQRRTGSTGRSGGGGSTSSGDGERMMDKIRSGKDKAASQAADKARGFVGQGIERSSDALNSVAKLVSDTAEGIDERLGSEYGDYARRAGSAIEDAARKLQAKDADELIDDTREFVRKSPGMALAGAAIIGFAVARLIKSGLDSGRDDDDTSGRNRGRTDA